MSEQLPGEIGMAGRAWQAWLRFLAPVGLGLWADLWVKAISFPDGVVWSKDADVFRMQGRNPFQIQTLVPHILGFQTTVNAGAVFGIAQGKVMIFVLFSVVAIGTIGYVFARSRRNQIVLHLALGLILAGALGNLYDRVVYHGVRDMLIFYAKWYPFIFNIADVLLCVGVPLLMVCWLFPGKQEKESGSFPVEGQHQGGGVG